MRTRLVTLTALGVLSALAVSGCSSEDDGDPGSASPGDAASSSTVSTAGSDASSQPAPTESTEPEVEEWTDELVATALDLAPRWCSIQRGESFDPQRSELPGKPRRFGPNGGGSISWGFGAGGGAISMQVDIDREKGTVTGYALGTPPDAPDEVVEAFDCDHDPSTPQVD